jgi:alcohol dehydrogenase class IV
MEVGGRIIDLVLQLGLQQTLSERGVSKNEIPTIVERATKLTEGREHSSVTVLVENFF